MVCLDPIEWHNQDMVLRTGHFDGSKIVLDEPADLKPKQRVLVWIDRESSDQAEELTDFSRWVGMAKPMNPNPRFKSDDDLWKAPTD